MAKVNVKSEGVDAGLLVGLIRDLNIEGLQVGLNTQTLESAVLEFEGDEDFMLAEIAEGINREVERVE